MVKIPIMVREWLGFEKIRVVVPVLAVIFAVIFDLGFFQAFGLG